LSSVNARERDVPTATLPKLMLVVGGGLTTAIGPGTRHASEKLALGL